MKTWFGPVLALLGVILTTGLGYYQWRRTNKSRREAAYYKRRGEILETLLRKLSELQLVSRRGTISQDELEAQTRELNEFLIEHGTVLSDKDRAQARQYVKALIEIHAHLKSAPVFKEKVWGPTMDRPTPQTPGPEWAISMPASFKEMKSAETHLQEQIRRCWESHTT